MRVAVLGAGSMGHGIAQVSAMAGALGKKTGEGFYVWEDGERVGRSDE